METIYLEKTTELKRAKAELEKKLKVKIKIQDLELFVDLISVTPFLARRLTFYSSVLHEWKKVLHRY